MSTTSKTPVPTGLIIPSQIPLNNKEYFLSESILSDLGDNNELAFTYYKGMLAYCAEENTWYEWKEVEPNDNTLLPINFTYPNGWIAEGIDYSNKLYNFNKIEHIVRLIGISDSQLSLPVTKAQLITYILSLPASERTIDQNTSKLNIIHYNGEIQYLNFVYELQNTGVGVITSINEDDLLPLFIYKEVEGIDETLEAGNQAYGKQMYLRDSLENPNNRVLLTPSLISLFRPTGANTSISPELISFYNPDFQGLSNDQKIDISTEGIAMTYGGSPSGSFVFIKFPLIVPNYLQLEFPVDVSGIQTFAVRSDIKPTKLINGTNTTVVGDGSDATPFQVNIDGSETKVTAGTGITVTGTGTTASPYVITSNINVKVVAPILTSWNFDRQHSLLTGIPSGSTILLATPSLICTTDNNGFVVGDTTSTTGPELNDSGGRVDQGIGIEYNNVNPTIVRVLVNSEIAVMSPWTADGAVNNEFALSDSSQWGIKVTIIYV